jgi:N6-L-threonylcarbamoyladenine synthase
MQSCKRKVRKTLRVLAIETSCDETSISCIYMEAIPNSRFPTVTVCAHIVESQIASHVPFGGVVPELAARDHLARIEAIAQIALKTSAWKLNEISHIAVTLGPGLIGSVMVGVLFARGLALALGIPLLGINHVDAHLAPAILASDFNPLTRMGKPLAHADEGLFPALALTVSGGHCHLSKIHDPFATKEILGTTLDDACGEAFDKVAKLLGFDYPGGPQVEKWAARVHVSPFEFPIGNTKLGLNFSFSGIKTAVLSEVRKLTENFSGKISGASLSDKIKSEICHSFQNAAFLQIESKLKLALSLDTSFKSLLVAGGVACNQNLRTRISNLGLPAQFAPLSLCSDNATMIGLQSWFSSVDAFKINPFSKYTTHVKS